MAIMVVTESDGLTLARQLVGARGHPHDTVLRGAQQFVLGVGSAAGR